MPELNLTPGLIPLPAMTRAIATQKIDGVGMNLLGPRRLEGVCLHRAQGYGAAAWLSSPTVAGLTDLVIHNETGHMTRINEITGTNRDMAGWAQGPYRSQAASADGRAFVAAMGGSANTINMHLESIEIEGFYGDPVSDVTKAKVVQWVASRAHDDGIPWHQFPIRNNGLTFIYGHREFCGIDYKLCPGSVVWAWMNTDMIEAVKEVMRAAQDGATPEPDPPSTPEYAKPARIGWDLERDLGWHDLNGVPVYGFKGVVTALRKVPPRAWASDTAPVTGPSIPKGRTTTIFGWFETPANGIDWYLLADGSRVRASAFDANFEVAPRGGEAA